MIQIKKNGTMDLGSGNVYGIFPDADNFDNFNNRSLFLL
jgi:hypothetical protein